MEAYLMADNEILSEIHLHREALTQRCAHDVERLFAYYREQQALRAAEGWRIVRASGTAESGNAFIVREDPPLIP